MTPQETGADGPGTRGKSASIGFPLDSAPRTPLQFPPIRFASVTRPIRPPPTLPDRPFLIGLVGGIASGKSTVAEAFRRRGARVIDADTLAKSLLDLPENRRALAAAFGDVETAGKVDAGKLAAAAFATAEGAKTLNAIMHPSVSAAISKQVTEWTDGGFRGAVIVDAPLLLEAGMKDDVDAIVYVEAPEAARRERARKRGWPEGELEKRERLQWPVEKKKAAANAVLSNAGAQGELELQVDRILEAASRRAL